MSSSALICIDWCRSTNNLGSTGLTCVKIKCQSELTLALDFDTIPFLLPGSFNHVANDIRCSMVAQHFARVPICIDSENLVAESLPNFIYIFEVEVQYSKFIKPQ